MKKTLILPYFGQFPDTFPIWLESCRNNPDFQWLLVSDIETTEELPDNVHILRMTFDELKVLFENKLGYPILLERPYKLCDFRGMYGFLFSDYIKDSDFWGYCDMDTIWGRISHFLPEELFEQYDKILHLGHLCFVRNTEEINTNFKKYDSYRIVTTSAPSYAYDEVPCWAGHPGFNTELESSGFKVYKNCTHIADIDFGRRPFHVIGLQEACVFRYSEGRTVRITPTEEKEVMYIHLQKRKMETDVTDVKAPMLVMPNVITSDLLQMEKEDFWLGVSKEDDTYFDMEAFYKAKKQSDVQRFKDEPHKIKALLWWVKCKLHMG